MAHRRTVIQNGEFSPTGLEDSLRCPRMFYIKKFLQMNPKHSKVAADFGAAFHAACALMYKDHSATIADMIEMFSANWKIDGDGVRNIGTAMQVLPKYYEMYSNLREWISPDEVEVPFELAMPNGTTLVGIIDHIIRRDGMIYPVDIKTTASPLTDWFWTRYTNSFQMGAYTYACNQIIGDIDTIQVSAINIKTAKESDRFSSRPMMRTELQQEEWLNTYIRETELIMRGLNLEEPQKALHFYQRQTACDAFGGCKYLGACRYGLNHPSIQVDMIVGDEDGEE